MNESNTEAFRQEELLVVPVKGGPLPNCCIRCGQPASASVRKEYRWTTPWSYLWLLLGLFLGAIIIALICRKVTMDCPLCDYHAKRRSRLVWMSVGAAICALVFYVGAYYLPDPWSHYLLLAGFVLIVTAPLPLAWSPFFRLRAKRIDKEFATIEGCDERFLAVLVNR